jgi:putative oxidoreductase
MFLLRAVISIMMLTHGMGKFDMLISHRAHEFVDPIGLGPTQSLVLAVFAEVFCSILILCGLFTRFACIPLIITMGVAVLGVHLNEGFGRWELPLLYLLIYVTIMVVGPAKYSLDRYIKKLRKQAIQ